MAPLSSSSGGVSEDEDSNNTSWLLASQQFEALSLSLSLSSYLLSAPYLALRLARWDLSPSVLCSHDVLLKSVSLVGKISFN